MKGEFLFLGTGGSMGVPVIGCNCSVCLSTSPHNKRFRSSAMLIADKKKLLIDCGPDFREQALRYQISHIDGLLLTHAHYDHIAGLDELRVYYSSGHTVPCLLSKDTAKEIKDRFSYIFEKPDHSTKVPEKIALYLLENDEGTTSFQDIPLSYLTYEQCGMPVTGYRFGNLAYISDIKYYSKSIFEQLKGLEYLIISALRLTESPSHFSLEEAVDFAKQVDASLTWITHVAHELDHEDGNKLLPSNVRMAYDGLSLNIEM